MSTDTTGGSKRAAIRQIDWQRVAKELELELCASRAENATLQAELAMATDAANKGDDARTKAGAMQDQISDLRNIVAGMFWAGGNFDDKTTGEVRALGLDCRVERDALAALVDEALLGDCTGNWRDRAKALRAPQTGVEK